MIYQKTAQQIEVVRHKTGAERLGSLSSSSTGPVSFQPPIASVLTDRLSVMPRVFLRAVGLGKLRLAGTAVMTDSTAATNETNEVF
jgi:hypothetical protein